MSAPASPDPAVDDLVRRAQRGDMAAFNALVLRYQDAVYSLALRMLGSSQPAEDAAQEAFVRAYRRIHTFRGGNFRSWLFSIVANLARDELRRRRRRPQVSLDAARDDPDHADLDPPEPGAGPEAEAERGELRRVLEAALLELPPDWREVVVLSDVHGLAYEEIAQVTGLPLGTVKSRLSRARGRLRELLRDVRGTGTPGTGAQATDARGAGDAPGAREPSASTLRLDNRR